MSRRFLSTSFAKGVYLSRNEAHISVTARSIRHFTINSIVDSPPSVYLAFLRGNHLVEVKKVSFLAGALVVKEHDVGDCCQEAGTGLRWPPSSSERLFSKGNSFDRVVPASLKAAPTPASSASDAVLARVCENDAVVVHIAVKTEIITIPANT